MLMYHAYFLFLCFLPLLLLFPRSFLLELSLLDSRMNSTKGIGLSSQPIGRCAFSGGIAFKSTIPIDVNPNEVEGGLVARASSETISRSKTIMGHLGQK